MRTLIVGCEDIIRYLMRILREIAGGRMMSVSASEPSAR